MDKSQPSGHSHTMSGNPHEEPSDFHYTYPDERPDLSHVMFALGDALALLTRIEGKVDWCVSTVNAATTALGAMPFAGAAMKKMGGHHA